jgi:hypothetical protein
MTATAPTNTALAATHTAPATTGSRSTPTPPPARSLWLLRRWPTGLGLVLAVASVAAMALLPGVARPWIGAWWVLTAAVVYLSWGTARGELGERGWLAVQTAGVLAFGTVAIAVVAVDLSSAAYVMAAGWLAHALWDVVHHRADKVVPRWYAEACMATDLTVAASLVTIGLA